VKKTEKKVEFDEMLRIFDLLEDVEALEKWLESLPEEQRDRLYNHPLLEWYDLLP